MKQKSLLFLILMALAIQYGWAQKKPLTHDVYDAWQSVQSAFLSSKGNVSLWEVNPQQGDGTLYIRDNRNGRLITLPRGHRARITSNEKYVVAQIKPLFSQTRDAKIKKKKAADMPKDSVAIIDLNDGSIKKIANVSGYSMGRVEQPVVAIALTYKTPEPSMIAEKEKAKKKKKNKKTKDEAPKAKVDKDAANDMLLYTFATGDTVRMRCVAGYEINAQGSQMAYVARDKKNHNIMKLANLSNLDIRSVSAEATFMSSPKFNWTGDRLMFMAATDTIPSGSRHCSLYEYRLQGGLRTVVSSDDSSKLIDGWGITDKSNPYYTRNGNRIMVGIMPYVAPDDKTKYDFETAEPSIWRYDADLIPPMFKLGELKNGTSQVTCTIDNEGNFIRLGQSYYDRLLFPDLSVTNTALSVDNTGRILEQQWDIQTKKRISVIDTYTGKRTQIADCKTAGETISPDGKHAAWFDLEKHHWMLANTSTHKIANITASLKVPFYNEDTDTPSEAAPYAGVIWTSDNRGMILTDRFDLWYIPLDGNKPLNLTQGNGRKDSIQYRFRNLQPSTDKVGFDACQPIYLSVYNYRTKENGFAKTDLNANLQQLEYGKYTYTSLCKADSANTFMVCKGNFEVPMNLWLVNDKWTQLSNINPQQADYAWGKPELFQWKAFDGTPLDGVLYKPDNFDPNKKYPVIVYFYERNSESLYRYFSPAPSRSIVNIPYFVSNGYIVFVPDVIYKVGHPGKSAYNCIVAGAKALAANKWVDSSHMAIQGQSWGGYQVAYLIAHTDMFAAGGAGAPVCNMTSAYGGIRWGTGISRQFQYEQTQSRIGKYLWSGFDLYIENSPLFDYPKVKTPVLIMHNNADGAVPYYQGIEMFMALRRLGKPAWLLEYNREAHNLSNRKNAKDLSKRLSDFFDHYLKGAPLPDWMKPDTPYIINGQAKRLY